MRHPLLPALFCLLLAFAAGSLSTLEATDADNSLAVPQLAQPAEMYLFPFGLMDGIREPRPQVPMQVQAYFSGDGLASLHSIEVLSADGHLLQRLDLQSVQLKGDHGLVEQAHLLMETIDPEIAHKHGERVFIPLDERAPLQANVEAALFRQLMDTMADVVHLGGSQLLNIDIDLNLSDLFPPNAKPGDEAIFDLILHYESNGIKKQVLLTHSISLLAPFLSPPSGWRPPSGDRGLGAWHAGDLHVHNCRDQAVSGCPDCAAESFNITGSFTNADLKTQFQALGMDWFSTTTHSYCINSDAEFNEIANEASILDDPSFSLLCGTELTTKESGPQSGTDIFDTVCFLGGNFDGRGTAHMGGHAITSRKPGGKDGFMDNCDNPLLKHSNNIDDVNAEGGFTIAHHPGGDTLSFNSAARFEGLERGQAVGTEIWNGTDWSGSPEHKAWWISRLLEGKFTWPFSGSDTHDSAVDFGANHVWLNSAISDAELASSMREGKHYLSNGPFLVMNLFDANNHRIEIGGVVLAKKSQVPNMYPVTAEVPYNFGPDSGDLKIYRGTVGDSTETVIHESLGISGQGTLQVPTTLPNHESSWFRAEFKSVSAKKQAYTSLIVIGLY
ncbi:MAG: hypothetical protein QGH51_00650 [Planctomycetota bacterium]|jgi:hypothetical protein|nr:hypothetical protein [Planctomycetota bacterium]MDP6940513.1 hypothetical protein [Planctomycetota bacterium]